MRTQIVRGKCVRIDACQLERRLLFSGSPIGDASDWDVQDLASVPDHVDLEVAHGFESDDLLSLSEVTELAHSPSDLEAIVNGYYETSPHLNTPSLEASQILSNEDLPFYAAAVGDQELDELVASNQFIDGGEVLASGLELVLKDQFQVSTETSGTQTTFRQVSQSGHNAVAIAPNGDYVVVWSDDSEGDFEVKARLFDYSGRDRGIYHTAFTVNGTAAGEVTPTANTTPGDQTQARVAIEDDGDFVVAWTDGTDIFYRRLADDGQFIDNVDVQVTSATVNETHASPDVDLNANGDLVVTWARALTDGTNNIEESIEAQLIPTAGAQTLIPVATNTIVDADDDKLREPVVAIGPTGKVVVVWNEGDHFIRGQHVDGGSATPFTIHARQPNPFPFGGSFFGQALYPSIDMNASGQFAVSWTIDNGTSDDVAVAFFQADATTATFEDTNVTNGGDDGVTSVQLSDTGQILTAWQAEQNVFLRRYDTVANSYVDAADVQVDQTTGSDHNSIAAAMLNDDNYVLVWTENPTAPGTTVQARQFGTLIPNPAEAPTISTINDTSVLVDTSTSPISFTIADPNTAIGSLNVTVYSDNQTLIPDSNITIGGTGANRTISLTPAATEVGGTVQVTVEVDDGVNFAMETFNVQVVPRVVVVTTAVDELDVDPLSVDILSLASNPGGTGVSLREAIYAVNNTAIGTSPDKIHFDIPGVGPHRISLNPVIDSVVALPTITDDVILDGTTEPNFDSLVGNPVVEIDGSLLSGNHSGISITAGDSTVRGLSIGGFATGDGIRLGAGNGNTIEGNWIGVASDGSAFGNGRDGVHIDGSGNNTIGGVASGEANTISNSGRAGINVLAGTGNTLRGNVIVGNAGTGIDLGNDGPNGNDVLDVDGGPNNRQNRPLISTVSLNGNGDLQIVGGMTGELPPPPLLIDFYATSSLNGGIAEGGAERWLGSHTFTGNVLGIVSFAHVIPSSGVAPGEFVSVTATDPEGDTSEFSPLVVANLVTPAAIDLDSDNSSGATGNDYSVVFNESDAPVPLADVDANATANAVLEVDISVSGIQDGNQESIQLDGTTFLLATDTVAFVTSAMRAVTITTSPGSGTASIQITDVDKGYFDASEVEALLQSITYQLVDDVPTSGSRLFDVQLTDGLGTGVVSQTQVSVNPVNDEPTLTGWDATPFFDVSAGTPVVLDGDVSIFDEELDASGSYLGATLLLERSGADNDDDVYGASGTLNPLTEGVGNLIVQGTAVGDVDKNQSGELRLTFGSNATTLLVNEVLRQITYANSNPAPSEGTVSIDLTFSDGNSGLQGSGGAQSVAGTIDIRLQQAPSLDLDADDSSGATGNDYRVVFVEDVTSELEVADSDVSLVDPDSSQFTEVAIDISGILDGNDEVLRIDGTEFALATTASSTMTLGGQYIVSVSPGATDTSAITIISSGGTFTNTETQTLIQAIRYSHLDQNMPTDGTRILSFQVNDGFAFNSVAQTTINVQATNDSPVYSTPVSQSTSEDVAIEFSAANGNAISVSDVDAGAGDLAVVLSVLDGTLTLANTAGLTVTNGANGTNLIAVEGSEADINAALDGLSYQPTANFNGSDSLTFGVSDLGNAGLGGEQINSGSVAFAIAAVNDAPVLDNTGTMTLADMNEDDVNSAGTLVADMILSAGGDRITDVDSSAIEGIAVTSVDDTNGTWQFSIDGGTNWSSFGLLSNSNATLLDGTALIRFVPNTNHSGSAGNIAFHAWDQTTGSNGATSVDVTTHGGSTAFSIASETATLSVLAVNEAPAFTNLGVVPNPVFDIRAATPVILDTDQDATLSDEELDSFAGYDGTTLRIQRAAGPNSDDVFGATGTLDVSGGNVLVGASSTNIGAVTSNGGGVFLLTFNSNADATLVSQVIQQITYDNANAAPTESSVPIEFVFSDENDGTQGTGGPLEATGSITIDIVTSTSPSLDLDANDSSFISGNDYERNFYEGNSPVRIADNDVDLSDPDSTAFDTVTLDIFGIQDGNEEIIQLNTASLGLASSTTQTTNFTTSTSTTFDVTISSSAFGVASPINNTIVISKTSGGSFTETEVEEVLDALRFQHTNTDTPTVGLRLIDISVADEIGGGPVSTSTMRVIPINDQPVISGLDNTPVFTEGSPAVVLDSSITITDVELDSTNYDGSSIVIERSGGANSGDTFGAISGSPVTGGVVTNGGGVTFGNVVQNSGGRLEITFNANATSALVEDAIQQITFSTTDLSNPSVSLDFIFDDGNIGAQGVNGGPRITTESIAVAIISLNEAPTLDLNFHDGGMPGNGYGTTFLEGDTPVSIVDVGDVVLNDPDDTSFTEVELMVTGILDGNSESIFVDGTRFDLATSVSSQVTANGYSVVVTTSLGAANFTINSSSSFSETQAIALLESIQYQHRDTDAPNDGNRSIEIRISDGTDFSLPATSTVDVEPINDAPVLTAFAPAMATLEDTELEITLADLLVRGDEQDVDGSVTHFVVETVNPGLRIGSDASSASAWAPGVNDTIDGTNNAYWLPPADESGAYTNMTVSAVDDLGASSSPVQVPIIVTAVNDLPVANPDFFEVSATQDLQIGTSDLTNNDTDAENDNLNVVITTLPVHGMLSPSPDGLSVIYRSNSPSFSGTDTFTYIATQQDGGGNSNPVTVTIEVTPVVLIVDGPSDPNPNPPDYDPGPGESEPGDPPTISITPPLKDKVEVELEERRVNRRPDTEKVEKSAETLRLPEIAIEKSAVPIFKPSRIESRQAALESTLEYLDNYQLSSLSLDTQLTSLWGELDSMEQDLDAHANLANITVGSIAGMSSVFTVGYITWLIRGGHIAAGLLAQMPAWQFIDPLPVLAGLDEDEDDDAIDDSAESMFADHSDMRPKRLNKELGHPSETGREYQRNLPK